MSTFIYFLKSIQLLYPLFLILPLAVYSLALVPSPSTLYTRQDGPNFPAQPPSCPLCAQNFGDINSCAQAAPVLENFTTIIFNPGAFIHVIECACTDTFESAYPQCADCLQQTNQTSFLNVSAPSIPRILTGLRNVCSIASILLGGAATADGEATPTSTNDISATGILTSAARKGANAKTGNIWIALLVTLVGILLMERCDAM